MIRLLMFASVSFLASHAWITTSAAANDVKGLIEYVAEVPRGIAGLPAQWFEMNSLLGWEPMMLVIGYADNPSVCQHLAEIARMETPDREFRCVEAN